MDKRLEELIHEIAVKHGVAVARDDPILILQTINNRLLNDAAASQQEQLDKFKEEMEGVSHRWQHDAKEKSERILNFAVAASKEAVVQAMELGGSEAYEKLRAVLDAAADRAAAQARLARQSALINFASACLVLLTLLVHLC